MGCLGSRAIESIAESGIVMTSAAIVSASSSYLSPGVLTVSLACIDDVSDDLAAASSRAHRLIIGSFFI
jgi:hypothetical protein